MMNKTDKFLAAIVAGIILLVVAAFVIVLRRPPSSYRTDDAPDATVENYLLALQQSDYSRAYGYLSEDLRARPASSDRFADDVAGNRWSFGRGGGTTTFAIVSSRADGDEATVSVRETTFYGGGLFGSSQSSDTFEMRLRRENGAWKIVGGESYWLACWDRVNGC